MPAHYLLVDGYNILFAEKRLAKIAQDSLDAARKGLCDMLSDFKPLSKYRIIVVFDAHHVPGGEGSLTKYNNITVVFTKEAETADHYIEAAAYKIVHRSPGRPNADKITVATSDITEQIIILGSGCARISAEDFLKEIKTSKESMRMRHIHNKPIKKNPIASLVDEATAEKLEQMRYGG